MKTILNRPLLDDWCEYNPREKRPAFIEEQHAPAVWIVGGNGQWRLCEECAQLPEFKRLRKRVRVAA